MLSPRRSTHQISLDELLYFWIHIRVFSYCQDRISQKHYYPNWPWREHCERSELGLQVQFYVKSIIQHGSDESFTTELSSPGFVLFNVNKTHCSKGRVNSSNGHILLWFCLAVGLWPPVSVQTWGQEYNRQPTHDTHTHSLKMGNINQIKPCNWEECHHMNTVGAQLVLLRPVVH